MIDFNCDAFNAFRTTLKNTSFDKENSIYMTELTITVVNFDSFIKDYCSRIAPKSGIAICSADAAFNISTSDICLVEFKNGAILDSKGRLLDAVKVNIRNKVNESLLSLIDDFNEPLDYFRSSASFVLVFNDSRTKSRNKIKSHLGRKSSTPIVLFGLDRYRGFLFKNVYTFTEAEFNSFITGIFPSS